MKDVRAEKVVIAGSGPAGLTAALYCARANLNPLLIEGLNAGGVPGGQLLNAGHVENYPGFPQGIGGPDLITAMREQAATQGTRFVTADVIGVELSQQPFVIHSSDGATYNAYSMIVATGAMPRRLPMDSEKAFWGKGISVCAICDGSLPIYRNKNLAVIGGGDSAVEAALHLTQFASKVIMIHRRDRLRASMIMQKRALNHDKIVVYWNTGVEEFIGDTMLTALRLKDLTTGEQSEIGVGGAFETIGHIPNTGVFKNQIELDNDGYIKLTNPNASDTSVDGLFAAGDVHDKVYKQAVTAAGCGCRAAIDAERWLQENRLV